MADPSVLQIVGGGLVGSAVTYALSWFRERRRTEESYRAPQRQAIGAIVAATHEYLLRQLELRTAMNDVLSEARAGGPVTSGADQWAATKALGATSIALESAFQIGALTITDAACWEAQVDAYAAFDRLKRAAQALAATPIESLDDGSRYLAVTDQHGDELKKAVGLLVRAAYGRVTPVGSLLNRWFRRKALNRSRERHQEQLGRTALTTDGDAAV